MKIFLAVFVLFNVVGPLALAQSVNTSTQSTSSTPASSPFAISWKVNADGPNFQHLDGQAGSGAALNMKNTFRFGYKLPMNFVAEISPIVTYKTANAKRETYFEMQDPYLAVKKYDIFNTRARGWDLYAEARYYVPVSQETKRAIGTTKDKADGQFMGRLMYAQTLFDGRLKNLMEYDYRRNFAQKPVARKGINANHEFYNWIYVPVTQNFSPYISYKNFVNRYTSGLGDPWTKSHTMGIGAKWLATKKLSLDPYIDSPFMLKDSTVGLEAIYTFI